MAQQTINNSESGLSVRDKINENFTELYDNVSAWQSWTPTVTGFTGTPTVTGSYKAAGNIGFLRVFVSGTSNTNAFTITNLPITPITANFYVAQGTNGGTSAYIRVLLAAASTTATLYPSATTTAWTTSGTKEAVFTISFEI